MLSKFIKSADDIDNLFKRPKPTVPCEKCGKLFRADSEQMIWSIRRTQYKNYCEDCYYKAVNENPSEEQVREWAMEINVLCILIFLLCMFSGTVMI